LRPQRSNPDFLLHCRKAWIASSLALLAMTARPSRGSSSLRAQRSNPASLAGPESWIASLLALLGISWNSPDSTRLPRQLASRLILSLIAGLVPAIHMWTAPACKGGAASDRVACAHMSGLSMRPRTAAGQDGFREASSKQSCGLAMSHWITRSISPLGSTDHTICSVSSKLSGPGGGADTPPVELVRPRRADSARR
jgi:hypothetical protein